jgi:hypothetical protein
MGAVLVDASFSAFSGRSSASPQCHSQDPASACCGGAPACQQMQTRYETRGKKGKQMKKKQMKKKPRTASGGLHLTNNQARSLVNFNILVFLANQSAGADQSAAEQKFILSQLQRLRTFLGKESYDRAVDAACSIFWHDQGHPLTMTFPARLWMEQGTRMIVGGSEENLHLPHGKHPTPERK